MFVYILVLDNETREALQNTYNLTGVLASVVHRSSVNPADPILLQVGAIPFIPFFNAKHSLHSLCWNSNGMSKTMYSVSYCNSFTCTQIGAGFNWLKWKMLLELFLYLRFCFGLPFTKEVAIIFKSCSLWYEMMVWSLVKTVVIFKCSAKARLINHS